MSGGGALKERSSYESLEAKSAAHEGESGKARADSTGDISPQHEPGTDSKGAVRKTTFAQMDYNTRARYVVTSKGVFHLTPTELQLVRTLEEMGEASVSKLDLSIRLQCNKRVVGRLISNLRREGVIETEAQYNESGAQLANTYRISKGVHPLDPDEAPHGV